MSQSKRAQHWAHPQAENGVILIRMVLFYFPILYGWIRPRYKHFCTSPSYSLFLCLSSTLSFYYIQYPASSSHSSSCFSSCRFISRHSTSFVLPRPSCKIHIHIFQPARLPGPKTQLLAWFFACNWACIRTTNTNETSNVGVLDVIGSFQYLEGRVGSVQCTHRYIYSCRCRPSRPPLLHHINPSSLSFLPESDSDTFIHNHLPTVSPE